MSRILSRCKYLLLFILIVLFSCNAEPEFTQTKFSSDNLKSVSQSPLKGIISYTIQYNAYSSGYVKLILADSSVYEGKNIGKEAMAPIIQLLEMREAVFDTVRKEVTILNKIRQ